MSQETVKTLLDKINLLFNVFMKEGLDKISPLEKDLLKEQINKLLKELDNVAFDQAKELTVEKTIIPPVEPIQEVKKEFTPELVKEEPKEVVQEVKAKPIPEKFTEKLPTVDQLIAPNADKEDEAINASSKSDERVFNDSKPLRDLKAVIDLNKSFIFKAELFDNSNDLYNSFITQLNGIQSEKESFHFVENMAHQKAWDKEGKVYELLLKAVEKRFLPLLQQ